MASVALMLLLAAPADLDAAEKALADGRAREALELLGDLADRDDADVRAWIVQGRAYLALQGYTAAVEPLLRASDARPDDRALARDAAWACWGSAQGAYARAYLEDAIRMAVRSGDLLLLADLHVDAGNLAEAVDAYGKAEVPESETLRVRMRVAECLRALGRDGATEAFAEALEEALRRGDLASAYKAAFAAERAGRFMAWLDEKLAATPDDLDLRLYRAYARAASLLYAEAAADLRVVLGKRPDFLAAKDQLSAVLIAEGQRRQKADLVDEGERIGREVLEAEPTNQSAWQRMSWLAGTYWTDGRVQRSYDLLKFLHGLDPEDVNTGLNFGAMARRLGHYEEARTAYEGLLEGAPGDPDVLNDLAILVDGMGERARAVELWEMVLSEDPYNLNALENLYTHAWERGDAVALETLLARGLDAATRRDGPVARWHWFRDRLLWAPSGFGG